MKIREMMPEKAKIIFVVVERLGIPTILCLVFAYIYFVKLQKLIEDVTSIRSEQSAKYDVMKLDHDEIKREVRRLSWGRNR